MLGTEVGTPTQSGKLGNPKLVPPTLTIFLARLVRAHVAITASANTSVAEAEAARRLRLLANDDISQMIILLGEMRVRIPV
jgi:hypothetical protein